ncbi:MAG: hypothetical protein KGH93_03585 [Patescibacteria group bacterium]|nr:hypothetical protein [Patescibacteria group bacterium]
MTTVTAEYLAGIAEGRAIYKAEGLADAQARIANLRATMRGFGPSSAVGQLLRGELDFWLNQVKRAAK